MQPSFSLTSTLGFDRLLKLRLVVADDETGVSAELPILFPPSLLPGGPAPEPVTALPDWIDREHWGWLAPE